MVIHSEISFFVYKHDLKQSQIARMAGVNQAYVSKFLRGEFFDLSENGKTLIYKWYLRFLKNPNVYRKKINFFFSFLNKKNFLCFFFSPSTQHTDKSIKRIDSQAKQAGLERVARRAEPDL